MGGGGVDCEGSTCGDGLAGRRTASVVCPAGACTGAAGGPGLCGIGVAGGALLGISGGAADIVGRAFGRIISG